MLKKIANTLISPRLKQRIISKYKKPKTPLFVADLLESGDPIRLELGAGGRKLDGYISIDLHPSSDIQQNLLERLPFPDHSVESIYSSHVLEHFSYNELIALISDCQRVLRQNGVFRAAVPNACIYIDAYNNPGQFDSAKYCLYKPAYHYHSDIDFINYIAYMDGHHKHMFDEKNLVAILEFCNLRDVRLVEFDPNIDIHERKYESIYVQSIK